MGRVFRFDSVLTLTVRCGLMTTQAKNNIRAGLGMLVVLSLLAGVPVSADIYMYRDADGVMHFTNTPVSTKYRIYVRSSQPRLRPSPGSRRSRHRSPRYSSNTAAHAHPIAATGLRPAAADGPAWQRRAAARPLRTTRARSTSSTTSRSTSPRSTSRRASWCGWPSPEWTPVMNAWGSDMRDSKGR